MSEKSPGFEEYTPSRLEWLVVMLNSYIHYINATPGDRFDFLYVTEDDGKTITLMIRHYNDVPPERLKRIEDHGKQFAMDMAKSYQWDAWLEIQTQVRAIEREK